MINIIKTDGKKEVEFLAQVRERSNKTNKDVTAVVSDIIENVRTRGDEAVKEYTIKFDGMETERSILFTAKLERG